MADEQVTTPTAEPADAAPDDNTRGGQSQAPDGAHANDETLQRERDEYYDRLLRTTAEFDNYRKRVERERRDQADNAIARVLEELLLVVDDFDRALTVDPTENAAAYRKGVELIHAKLHDLLKKQGVKPIEALGADFDPNMHQAVMHEPVEGHRDNEVIGELRKGYTLNDRLLRPSMVKVAKA